MWTSTTSRYCTTFLLVGSALFLCGCSEPEEEESPQTRQAQATADRKKALEYLDEDGNVDWRKRVDAASEALDEAKSDHRWGSSKKALEHALEAAQLMPPESKDFDTSVASTATAGSTETLAGEASSGETSGASASGTEASSGETLGGQGDQRGSGGEPTGEGGTAESASLAVDPVSNDEVQKLRESIQSLLESLDGSTGRARSDLSFERDPIEIR